MSAFSLRSVYNHRDKLPGEHTNTHHKAYAKWLTVRYQGRNGNEVIFQDSD